MAAEFVANSSAITELVTMSEYELPIGLDSHVQPVAVAAAAKQFITRSTNSSSCSLVWDRTYHDEAVWLGTMLGASPPWVMMPWMRSVGRMCWRRVEMLT